MPKKVEVVIRTFISVTLDDGQTKDDAEYMVGAIEDYISTQLYLDYDADEVETELLDVEVYDA